MVKLALVGTGKWGIKYLITIEKMNDCEITHIVSKTSKSLSRFSDKYKKLTNYADLLNVNTLDGIIIATPGSTHNEVINKLIRKYPLLVEKPLTLSLREALQIKKLANKNKSSLMVGHIYLHNPAYKKIKDLVPTIGDIRYISFKGYNYGPFRDDMSALWEYAPHGISIFIDIMKTMPLSVSAWCIDTLRPKIDLCDNAYIKLTFKNNVECVMEYGWLYPYKRRELIIYGKKHTLVLDELAEKKVSFYKGLGPSVKHNKVLEKKATVQHPQYDPLSPLEAELDAFINLIKSHKDPLTNLDHGINVMRVISAAEQSLRKNGKTINI